MNFRALATSSGELAQILEIRLGAVEDRRDYRDIAFLGEAIGHRADVVIDAKNLLDHDNGAFWVSRGMAR